MQTAWEMYDETMRYFPQLILLLWQPPWLTYSFDEKE